MIRATVSGSFRRHMTAIYDAVATLTDMGVKVLSPSDPRVVDQIGDFVFVASDRVRSIRMVQDRHLESIRSSSFLWLVTPDGYVGQSAAMEVGYAAAVGTPIYCSVAPSDQTLSKYVHVFESIQAAVTDAGQGSDQELGSFLLNPSASINRAHADLEVIERLLQASRSTIDDRVATRVYQGANRIANMFAAIPGRPTLTT